MEGIMEIPIWELSEERRATANITKFISFVNMRHEKEFTENLREKLEAIP